MRVVVIFFMLIVSTNIYSYRYPNVIFSDPESRVRTVYYGETVQMPFTMIYSNLKGDKNWSLPAGAELRAATGDCPLISMYPNLDTRDYGNGSCTYIISISASYPGEEINGYYVYYVKGKDGVIDKHKWDYAFPVREFSVKFIPHPLSMVTPEKMLAVAGKPFSMSLAKYISFYSENVSAGQPPELTLSSDSPKGLVYDPKTLSIVGTPDQRGYVYFTAVAHNSSSRSAPVNISIEVAANHEKRPRLKTDVTLPAYSPGKHYEFNLMELVDNNLIAAGDSLSFVLYSHINDSRLFSIDPENKQLLRADIPAHEIKKSLNVTVVAVSNIGGESLPLTLEIPMAQDPAYTPSMQSLTMNAEVDSYFSKDFASVITDPSNDGSLRLLIDKIEPDAPWLQLSKQSSTAIEGRIPNDAYGRQYTLYLRVANDIGGASAPVVSYLKINRNTQLSPYFNKRTPSFLPELIPGQSYDYCFNDVDIEPSYDKYPYSIRLMDGMNEEWISIKDNCLHADRVPDDLYFPPSVYVVVHNEPGGDSEVFGFRLPLEDF